jgi:thymidylate synthase (FAD)
LDLRAEIPALRRQDTKNRQNSIDDLDPSVMRKYEFEIAKLYSQSFKLYTDLILDGVAKECAREVLPLATPTRLYMAGSIRSWLHYIDLRAANGTQKEHRDIALACKKILAKELPTITAAMWTDED